VAERVHVVFIHGLFSSCTVWSDFLRLIGQDPDLRPKVSLHCFEYDSPVIRLRPDRRIPDVTDIADQLRGYLTTQLPDTSSVALVTHSQGGLIAQRYLARMVYEDQGMELARIKRIVMFACPTNGSDFLDTVRKRSLFARSPQPRGLLPLERDIADTQKTVLRAVVNATAVDATHCPIPFDVYGAASDGVVPPASATAAFPHAMLLAGDHRSIVRPRTAADDSFQALKIALITVVSRLDVPAVRADPDPVPGPVPAEAQGYISVQPPYGRRDSALHGRNETLAEVLAAVTRPGVQVLTGLGGSGKSRLALEVAYRLRGVRNVWWVSTPQINLHMQELARQLGAPESALTDIWKGTGSATDLVWRLLKDQDKPWLLIFDNADDPERLGPGPGNGAVSDGTGWLREPPVGGAVIVTSGDSTRDVWGSWSAIRRIEPLDPDDGASMLVDRTNGRGGTFMDAQWLSRELGGLPVALRAASDYVSSQIDGPDSVGADSINSLFKGYRAAVKRRFAAVPGAAFDDSGGDLNLQRVKPAFDLSLELLKDRGLPEAESMLILLAGLGISPIPYHMLLSTEVLAVSPFFPNITTTGRRKVLAGLAGLGLVELHAREDLEDQNLRHTLSMHPVVHGLYRGTVQTRDQHQDYFHLAVQLLQEATSTHPPDEPDSWEVWSALATHVLELISPDRLAANTGVGRKSLSEALRLARFASRYMIAAGFLRPATDLVSPLIERCADFGFAFGDPHILELRHERARITLERGQRVAAEEQLRQIIEERVQVLGTDHVDTLASRHKLARAVLEQGRWFEAEKLLSRIVHAELAARGPQHSDTITVQHSLARAKLNLDRAAEAEADLRGILRVCDSFWTPRALETLWIRDTLVQSLIRQGKLDEAGVELDIALDLAGPQSLNPQAMRLRFVQSRYLLARGLLSGAERVLELLLPDQQNILGADHPDTLLTLERLVTIRRDLPPRQGRG
jgi:pimeloyl-ACP methyl ester carboxylesterase